MRQKGMADALTVTQLFDAFGVRLDAAAVEGVAVTVNWHITDLEEDHVLGLMHCALHHSPRHR